VKLEPTDGPAVTSRCPGQQDRLAEGSRACPSQDATIPFIGPLFPGVSAFIGPKLPSGSLPGDCPRGFHLPLRQAVEIHVPFQ
jgi:hypothetical protein